MFPRLEARRHDHRDLHHSARRCWRRSLRLGRADAECRREASHANAGSCCGWLALAGIGAVAWAVSFALTLDGGGRGG